ncbi:MAG: DnaD domain protein [Lachnospiraceae bacterium]|nr:DnaD domain protein [Lachnospiraceae bacterium]
MAVLNIYKENLSEYTVISNYFIDYYMEDANEAQLQVYLYLLRMVSANLPVSVSDIADKFKHSEKEVLRALKYWELQKLITLEMDSKKNVTGIYFHAIPIPMATAESHPVTHTNTEPHPVAPVQVTYETPSATQMPTVYDSPVSEPIPTTDTITEEEKPSIYIKPTYTAEQLKNFKAQDNAAQLLYVAQAYVGKPLSVNDVKTIYFMWDVLHFSDDLIDYLIQYCVERGKKDFRYMEKVAINWAEEGITTPKQAQMAASKYDKSVYTVMNALGKSGAPTAKESEYIQRWTNEYGFSTDIIIEACERTVLATDKHRFEYAEGILSNWKREKVYHKADIARVDEQYQKKKGTASKPASSNRFNQFTQNTYDFAALEQELLSN